MHLRSLLSWTLVLAAGSLVASGAAQAKGKTPPWFQYVVPFTCGNNPSDLDRAVPGDFALAVNVLNTSGGIAQLVKQVQLTYPPGGEQPGAASSLIQEDLPAASAMQVSCAEIRNEFVYPTGAPTGLVQGVLVIKSSMFVDVSATHFASGPSGGISQEIEPVFGHAVAAAPLPESGSLTICHIPPGNPGNAHTITVDAASWPAHQGHGDYQGPCTNGH